MEKMISDNASSFKPQASSSYRRTVQGSLCNELTISIPIPANIPPCLNTIADTYATNTSTNDLQAPSPVLLQHAPHLLHALQMARRQRWDTPLIVPDLPVHRIGHRAAELVLQRIEQRADKRGDIRAVRGRRELGREGRFGVRTPRHHRELGDRGVGVVVGSYRRVLFV